MMIFKSSAGRDQSAALQVVASNAAEAVRAVQEKVGRDVLVEADEKPLTLEDARHASLVSGKVLLS